MFEINNALSEKILRKMTAQSPKILFLFESHILGKKKKFWNNSYNFFTDFSGFSERAVDKEKSYLIWLT